MTKMLLIGELNDTLYSLHECLQERFQIQMCSESARNVKDMARLFRPGILLFHISQITPELREIFETLKVRAGNLPILAIGTQEMEKELRELLQDFRNHLILVRPVTAGKVLKGCYELLGEETASVTEKRSGEAPIRKRILVIDDSALVLREIKNLLGSDYEVMLARSGEQGIEFIRKKRPDLILLDYDMPGMDGRETFELIKADEEMQQIPVVFLTAVAQKDQIMAVLKNLPQGYILKPPAKDKLLEAIKEALDEYEVC